VFVCCLFVICSSFVHHLFVVCSFVVCSSFVHPSFVVRSFVVRSFVVRSSFVRPPRRKYSRRARNYMLTYKSLEIIGNNDGSQQNINTISHLRIENLQKSVACHRAAVDFDKGFILQSVKMVAGFDVEHDHQPWPS